MTARLTSPDWFRMITDLIYAGFPMKEVCRQMDLKMHDGLLRAYRAGTQPTYLRGEALVRFWCEKLGKTREDVPVRPWIPPVRLNRRAHKAARKEGKLLCVHCGINLVARRRLRKPSYGYMPEQIPLFDAVDGECDAQKKAIV